MITPVKKNQKSNNSSFYFAFNFLPKARRKAMNIIYDFCRITDNIVDNNDDIDTKSHNLFLWREEFNKALINKSDNEFLKSVANIITSFKIPVELFYDLFKGMEMDLMYYRYNTFDSLKQYCYCVASTVGLISIEIFGYNDKSTKNYAINLGIALQLTNIIRDISKDLQWGRIYIPLEDLKKFNYTENDLFNQKYDYNFIKLMKFQVERAKMYFQLASNSLIEIDRRRMFPARSMQNIYYRVLTKIENNNYNVLDKNIRLNNFEKFFISLIELIKNLFI